MNTEFACNKHPFLTVTIAWKFVFLQFWPRLFAKKWFNFKQTGDDFDQDSDSNTEESSEELEDFDGEVFFQAHAFFNLGQVLGVGFSSSLNWNFLGGVNVHDLFLVPILIYTIAVMTMLYSMCSLHGA